jgi:hypothetical protein
MQPWMELPSVVVRQHGRRGGEGQEVPEEVTSREVGGAGAEVRTLPSRCEDQDEKSWGRR